MRTSKAVLALLCILYALQCTVEAKWRGGGRKSSSSGSRWGSRGSGSPSHSSPSSHHTSTAHHIPSSHHTPSSHVTSNTHLSSSHSVSKPASPPIGWNVGGTNSISSGHATFQAQQPQRPTNNHASYPVQSQPIRTSVHGETGIHGQSKASPPIHTPIQSTSHNQVHSSHSSQPQSNVHTPLQQTKQHQVQSSYPVQSYHTAHLVPPASVGGMHQAPVYHAPNTMPAGATYYPSAGAMPAGATFYPHAGVSHVPVYHAPVMALPPGATFYASPAALPVGATFYPQPPRTSSGPGFGTGLVAGAIGQSLLSRLGQRNYHDRVEHHYDHNNNNYNNNGEDRVIIINNGPAGSVQATPVGQGTTIIQTEVQRSNTANPQYAPAYANQNLNQIPPPVIPETNVYQNSASPQIVTDDFSKVNGNLFTPNPLIDTSSKVNENLLTPKPLIDTSSNSTTTLEPLATNLNANNPPQPGGIVCIPMLVNETDPQDSSNVTEVERIACFLAPTEELQATEAMPATNETAQQLPAGAPFFGNDQAPFKPSETLTSIDEINKQPVLSSGINQNYMPSDPSQPVEAIINTKTQQEQSETSKTNENSSAENHKVHIGNVLTLLLFFIIF